MRERISTGKRRGFQLYPPRLGGQAWRVPGAGPFILAILLALMVSGSALAQITVTTEAHVTNLYAGGLHPEAGTVTGGGTYGAGDHTFTATPNNDYRFSHWIVNATQYGPDAGVYDTQTLTLNLQASTTVYGFFASPSAAARST